eukprot:scaffold226_cov167-Pinguiococcus_pyrenoidosus.AAC.10
MTNMLRQEDYLDTYTNELLPRRDLEEGLKEAYRLLQDRSFDERLDLPKKLGLFQALDVVASCYLRTSPTEERSKGDIVRIILVGVIAMCSPLIYAQLTGAEGSPKIVLAKQVLFVITVFLVEGAMVPYARWIVLEVKVAGFRSIVRCLAFTLLCMGATLPETGQHDSAMPILGLYLFTAMCLAAYRAANNFFVDRLSLRTNVESILGAIGIIITLLRVGVFAAFGQRYSGVTENLSASIAVTNCIVGLSWWLLGKGTMCAEDIAPTKMMPLLSSLARTFEMGMAYPTLASAEVLRTAIKTGEVRIDPLLVHIAQREYKVLGPGESSLITASLILTAGSPPDARSDLECIIGEFYVRAVRARAKWERASRAAMYMILACQAYAAGASKSSCLAFLTGYILVRDALGGQHHDLASIALRKVEQLCGNTGLTWQSREKILNAVGPLELLDVRLDIWAELNALVGLQRPIVVGTAQESVLLLPEGDVVPMLNTVPKMIALTAYENSVLGNGQCWAKMDGIIAFGDPAILSLPTLLGDCPPAEIREALHRCGIRNNLQHGGRPAQRILRLQNVGGFLVGVMPLGQERVRAEIGR